MDGALTIGALSLIAGYLVYDTYFMGAREWIESRVDGEKYLVQSDYPDKQEAADMLAQMRKRLETLVEHLGKMMPSDPRTQRIVLKFQPDKMEEGRDSKKYSSYTIEKGEKIIFCLRSKDAKKELSDLNTMMFVALHEIAHIASEGIGHGDEFWDNFRWILEEGINIGIYQEVDYEKAPQQYCGITISNSPLRPPSSQSH